MSSPVPTGSRWRRGVACAGSALVVLMVTVPRVPSKSSQPFFLIAAVAAVAVMGLLPRKQDRDERWSMPWLAVAFVTWCALSVTWSSSARTSLKFTLFTAFVGLLALVPASRLRHSTLVRALACAMGLMLGASAAYTLAGGEFASRHNDLGQLMYQGVYGNWNILGYTIVLLLPGLLAVRPRTRWGAAARLATLAAAMGGLVLARSATSLIAALVLLAVALALRLVRLIQDRQRPGRGRKSWRRLGLAAAVLAVGAGAGGMKVIGSFGKDLTTLSGRTELWDAIGTVGSEAPWTGFGWGAVWRYHWLRTPTNDRYEQINSLIAWPLAHGHSTVFDIAAQTGAIGAALAVTGLVVLLYRALMRVSLGVDEIGSWALLVAVALVVVGITEPILSAPIGWFMLVLGLAVTPHARPPRRGPRRMASATEHDDIAGVSPTPATT